MNLYSGRAFLALLLPVAAGAQARSGQTAPIRGFPADAVAAQHALEQRLRSVPSADSLRARMRLLSEEPHEAGTERSRKVAEMILAAGRTNDQMPGFTVEKLKRLLAERGTNVSHLKVLLLGVTYKKDVADLRESAALEVLRYLRREGHEVVYHDPMIPEVQVDGETYRSAALTDDLLRSVDGAILLVPHSGVNYDLVVRHAPLILDTGNALKGYASERVVPL